MDAKLTKKIDEQINSNYGLLDVVTERICFFCSQERYVYNMWRGFSAEGAQHQMKQHIRSHKEPTDATFQAMETVDRRAAWPFSEQGRFDQA